MIKLIASDLDGTLLDEYASISKNNLIALSILKKQNIEFIIATWRDYQGIESIKDKYQLSYEAILGNRDQLWKIKIKFIKFYLSLERTMKIPKIIYFLKF